MPETIIVESADGDAPLNPRLLREIRDLLREDDDLDLGLRLTNRPPAPGEQGAVPVALEVLGVTSAAARPFAKVFAAWFASRRTTIKLRDRERVLEIDTGDSKPIDVEAMVKQFLDDGHEKK